MSVVREDTGDIRSINLENPITKDTIALRCTRVVITVGAWTPQVHSKLFPASRTKISITPLAGHSLVLRSSHWLPPALNLTDLANDNHTTADRDTKKHNCHAFTTDVSSGFSPELFSRMSDGHICLAGLNSSTYPLPAVANERVIDQSSIVRLKKTALSLLGDEVEVLRESVCWRPVAR